MYVTHAHASRDDVKHHWLGAAGFGTLAHEKEKLHHSFISLFVTRAMVDLAIPCDTEAHFIPRASPVTSGVLNQDELGPAC